MDQLYHDPDLDWRPGGAIDPSSPSFGDYLKELEASAHGTAAAINSGVSTLSSETGYSDGAQLAAINARLNRGSARDITETMTPAGQQAASGDFAHHPVSSALMTGVGMIPAAGVGVAGGALGGAIGGGGALAAGIGAGVANAGLSAGQGIEDIAGQIDAVPDGELRKQASQYDGYRALMPEADARLAFRDFLATDKGRVVLNALAGGVGGGLGVAGKIGGQVAGNALLHGAEAAAGGAIQGGVNAAVAQDQDVAGGFTPEGDATKVAESAATGAVIGAVAGAAHGRVTGERSERKYPKQPSAPKAPAPAVTPPSIMVDETQGAALKAKLNPTPAEPAKAPPPTEPTPAPVAAEAAPSPPQAQQTPTPPVTTEGNAPPPTDAAIPEAPNTLALQQQELTSGKRDVMVFKAGETPLPLPKGFTRVQIGPDTYDFNPGTYTKGAIVKLIRQNKIGEALGLGPVTKEQAVASEAQGATPVAVTERAPDGTEVKTAAGTTETAPTQLASIDAQKAPDNTVQAEPPQAVLADRQAAQPAAQPVTNTIAKTFAPGEVEAARAQPRVLEDVSKGGQLKAKRADAKAEKALAKNLAPADAVSAKVGRKDLKPEDIARRQVLNRAAQQIVEAHPAGAAEANVAAEGGGGKLARLDMRTRAKKMLDALAERRLELPQAVRDNNNPEHNYNEHVALLARARKIAKGNAKITEYAEFAEAEKLARAGDRANLVELHRAKNNAERGGLGSVGMENSEARPAEPEATTKVSAHELAVEPDALREEAPEEENTSPATAALRKVEADKAEVQARIAARRAESASGAPAASRADLSKVKVTSNGRLKSIPVSAKVAKMGLEGDKLFEEMSIPEFRAYIQELRDALPKGSMAHRVAGDELGNIDRSATDKFGLEKGGPWYPPTNKAKVHISHSIQEELKLQYRRMKEENRHGAKHDLTPFEEALGLTPAKAPHAALRISAQVAKMALGDKWETPVSGKESTLPVTSSGTLADAIGELNLKRNDAAGMMSSHVAGKLLSRVGHVEVHLVEGPSMDAVVGKLAGFYDPKHDHIVLRTDIAPGKRAHVILHEALHAALYHAIEASPKAKGDIRMLMREFSAATGGRLDGAYAFTNEHEFVSEFLSSPRIQELAARTPLSGLTAARLGLAGKAKTLWNGIIQAFARALGLGKEHVSVLDGVARVAGKLGLDESGRRPDVGVDRGQSIAALPEDVLSEARDPERAITMKGKLLSGISDQIASVKGATDEGWRKHSFKFLSNDQVRQWGEKLFGALDEKNPLRRLADGIERAQVRLGKLKEPAAKLESDLWQAQRKFEGPAWDSFADLQERTTRFGVHPDEALGSGRNAHLKLSNKKGDEAQGNDDYWQARAKHPELAEQYRELPPELQELYKKAREFHADDRDAATKVKIKNVLAGLEPPKGSSHADIEDRVFNGTMTDEDKAHYDALSEGAGKAIAEAKDLHKLQGPYFPQTRRGDYVVTGQHDIKTPANATREGNHFDFNTREEAHAWATKQDVNIKHAPVYFDPDTGEKTTKSNESLTGSPVKKYRVTIEPSHMELAETKIAAEEARQRMLDAGLKDVSEVGLADKNKFVEYGLHSGELQQLIKSIERRTDLSADQKAQSIQALRDASISMQRGNRLSKHNLKRKNVTGASTDVIRNFTDHAHASAAYRARAEFKNEIDGALDEMRKITSEGKADPSRLDRDRVVQEFEKRLIGFGSPEYAGKLGPVWQKIILLNFLKRMASPAHLALHLAHPVMTSMPVVGGERGFARTYREFYRAYKDAGSLGALGEGAKGAARVGKADSGPTNLGAYFREQVKRLDDGKALTAMFDHLESVGRLHADAGFDTGRYAENHTSLDRGLGRVDRTFRELTTATEAVNRYTTAIAAYRLAIKDHETPEQAVRYAQDTVSNTQGHYSSTNAAPIFRGGGMKKAFFQFKQYPALIIHLMGKLIVRAFDREHPEAQKAAIRSFAGMMGTAALLTGFNGLPTEAVKAITMVGNALGVTPSWDETTDDMRRGAAHEFGPELGGLLMNGLSSLGPTAVDVHHRLGFSSMLTFGEPRSDSPDDVMNWLYGTLGGAVGSLGKDTLHGLQAAVRGDVVDAAKYLLPVKAIDDVAKAAQLFSEGKHTPSGQQSMPPLDIPAALVQALGFTPRIVADTGEARYRADKAIRALPPSKPRLGPKGQQILGIARSKRNAAILDDYSKSYGVQ